MYWFVDFNTLFSITKTVKLRKWNRSECMGNAIFFQIYKVRSLNIKTVIIVAITTCKRGLGSNVLHCRSIFSLLQSEIQTSLRNTFLAIIKCRFERELISLLYLFISQWFYVCWCSCSISQWIWKWSLDQPCLTITFFFYQDLWGSII